MDSFEVLEAQEISEFDENSILSLFSTPQKFSLNKERFADLWEMHPPRHKIQMYGRDIEVYRYSVSFNIDNDIDDYEERWFVEWIQELRVYVEKTFCIKVNTAYINWYEDGKASIAKHRDAECVPCTSVVGFNFGASRAMRFGKFESPRTKKIDKSFPPRKFIMKNNSMYLMETVDESINGFQEGYWHEVPKTSSVSVHPYAGIKRISVTFRLI